MATPKTVTGLIQGADGRARSGAVSIVLSQPAYIAGTAEVVAPPQSIAVDSSGAWSALLYANNDLTPNGTYYTVRISSSDGGFQQLTIQVPQTAGPFEVANLVTSTPTASPTPNHVSTLTVDGAATFTAGPVVIGTDPGGAQLLRVGGSAHVSGLLTLDAGLTVTAGAVSLPATSIADAALSANVALLAGAQTFSGVKTFSANPVFNANAIPESAVANLTGDLAARALDSAVVHLAGAETISGAKTFSATPSFNNGIAVIGQVQISGANAGYIFGDRAGGANPSWQWYATGGIARLYNGSDLLTVGATGAVTVAQGLTVSAGGVIVGTDPGGSELVRIGGSLKVNSYGAFVGASLLLEAASDGVSPRIQSYSNRTLYLNPLGNPVVLGAGNLGFYGTAPIAKPAASGSRGGNAALASLLTQLAALGLITDSTTA